MLSRFHAVLLLAGACVLLSFYSLHVAHLQEGTARASDSAVEWQASQSSNNTGKQQVQRLLELLKRRGAWGPAEEFQIKDRFLVEEYLRSPEFAARKARLAAAPSRGIMIPAGRAAQTLHAYLAIRMIREVLKSSMPVEVIYNGQREYHPTLMPMIEQLPGVTVIDASQLPLAEHHGTSQADAIKNGWPFKTWALYAATSFKEVLLMDADNTPVLPPEDIFNTPQYQQHGNLFWPDFLHGGETGLRPTPYAYRQLGLPYPWDNKKSHFHTVESGQVLLDRARHADVLEWLWFLNSHHRMLDNDVWGDKDTFEMAFMLANKTDEYQQVRVAAGQAIGPRESNGRYRHLGMTQHLADGRIAFYHRTAQGKFLEYCLAANMSDSPCRVNYVASPLTVPQTIHCSNLGWAWEQGDLEFEAWDTLNCSHTGSEGGVPEGPHFWPGIRCTGSTSKVPVVRVSKLGQAGQLIEKAFEMYVEVHGNTARDWSRRRLRR